QPFTGRKDIALETADELVVVVDRGLEPAAYALEVFGRNREPFIKLRAHPADFLRIASEPVLPPDLRHGAADGDEVSRGGKQHAAFESEVPQCRVVLKRGSDEVLAGHEH